MGGDEATKSAIDNAREKFNRYMEDHFTSVRGLTSYQREFLCCGWPYLYTLNLDDAIESLIGEDYTIVCPYDDIKRRWYEEEHASLIKLHGDAGRMVRSRSGATRIVLAASQYLKSITDDSNAELLQWLVDDCSSKDLMFIGCSLDNEQDILFAHHSGISKLTGPSASNSIYVNYDDRVDTKLPFKVQRNLLHHGINNILRLKHEEFEEFYHIVAQVCGEQMSRLADDALDQYTGFAFRRLNRKETSADYLLCDPGLITYSAEEAPIINLPSFFVHRSVSRNVADAVFRGDSICAILGRRYSGKTYALLGLVDILQRAGKRVYFFTGMELSDAAVKCLESKEDCVLVFDADTIKSRQVPGLLESDGVSLEKRRTQLVFAVDQSDKYFIENASDEEFRRRVSTSFELNNKLNYGELNEFNKRIGELETPLVERRAEETFLDYALRIDESVLSQSASILPDSNFLATAEDDMLVAVLALAFQPAMYVGTANRLGIAEELSSLCKDQGRAVQMDYLNLLEVGVSGHSGTKYVSNSMYWLTKCLRNYTKVPERHKEIAAAFKKIVARQKKGRHPTNAAQYAQYYRSMKPYLYFDTLKDLFGEGKRWEEMLDLFALVYGELSTLLSGSYQFLHQYAKCEHRRARVKTGSKEVLDCLTRANTMLDRAYQLAMTSTGVNKQYSLAHIQVSKALTLTTYLQKCEPDVEHFARYLIDAIDSYHYALVDHPQYVADDFAKEDSDSFHWFVNGFLGEGGKLRGFVADSVYRRRVDEIMSARSLQRRWPRRNVRIDWGD